MLEAFFETRPLCFDSVCTVFTAAALPPLAHNSARSKHAHAHTHAHTHRRGERQGRAILPQIISKKKI